MSDRVAPKLYLLRRMLLLSAATSMLAMPAAVRGQQGNTVIPPSTTTLPVYDVVSVKPNKSNGNNIRISFNDDSFEATNAPLKVILQIAYGIRQDLISGGPEWIGSDRFDIKAKVLDPNTAQLKKLSREQRAAMLLPLLADRFQVKAHKETKELPVYELVQVKGGSKLKEAPPEPTPSPNAPDAPKPKPGTGRGSTWIQNDGHNLKLTATAVKLESLTNVLAQELNRTVIDKTGLAGNYDISLKFAPENAPPQDTAGDDAAPSLFTALQEQLGLKLQPSKGPVETLVVDHVEPPSED